MKSIIVAKTTNGQVIYCDGCRLFHIEYGNIHLSLWIESMHELWEYLTHLDLDHMEYMNRDNVYKRKIMISMEEKRMNLVFNKEELLELQSLLEQAIDRAVMPEAFHAQTEY